MRPPGPIRWSQGLLLLPQHFQQSDLHHAAALRDATGLLHPFPWGVRGLRIDVDALETDVLRVSQCEMVMPDGTVVRYPEAGDIAEASFKDAFPPTAEVLGVWACLPTLEGLSAGARRFADREEPRRRDLYDADSETAVVFVVPRIELLFTNDPDDRRLAGYERMKIAEIRRTGRPAPRYELSRHYIPPVVVCEGAPVLMTLLRQVHDQVAGAINVLAERRQISGDKGLAEGVGDFKHLVALQALCQLAPALHVRLAHGGGHPLEMYELLVALRGMLTCFSTASALDFPPYEHTDLAGCFLPVTSAVRDLLGHLLPTDYEEVPLQREEALFYAMPDEKLLREGTAFVLAVRTPGSLDDLRNRMQVQGKIGASDEIDALIRKAVTGVKRRYLEHPPPEVPRHAEYGYFLIETSDPGWRRIRDECDFAFFLPDAEPEVDVHFYVVMPRGRRQ